MVSVALHYRLSQTTRLGPVRLQDGGGAIVCHAPIVLSTGGSLNDGFEGLPRQDRDCFLRSRILFRSGGGPRASRRDASQVQRIVKLINDRTDTAGRTNWCTRWNATCRYFTRSNST